MKGIIFDMDGTMVDNMMIHHKAWKEELQRNGIHMSMEEVMEKVHGVNIEILERLFGDRFTPEERVEISKQKEIVYQKLFLPQLKLIDGLAEFLEAAKAANIPMAIGSAAPPENVNFVLDNLNLRHYFKAIYHSGNVEKGKPNPEVYHKAAAGMGLKSSECFVFEDSITGAETAKNAACPTIIIKTVHKENEFKQFDHIRKFINNFKELPFENFVNSYFH